MNQERIIELINKAGKKSFFAGKLDDDKINNIEKTLNLKLPNSYKWFLKEYGTGGVDGVDILGGGIKETPTCIVETLDWRKFGLPESFLVIENCDEWLYCLDTSYLKDGECTVTNWSQVDGFIEDDVYENFYTFIEKRFTLMLGM